MSSEFSSSGTVVETVHSLWRTQPDRPFLHLLSATGGADRYTYGQVVERGLRWTRYFAGLGVQSRQHVAVILPHSIDLYCAYLGAFLGGAVPAMVAFPSPKLSVRDYGATIGKLLDNAAPAAVITYPELQQQLAEFLRPEQLKLVHRTPDELPAVDLELLNREAMPDDVAFLQYSSGTTGLKKGVAITHRALAWQVRAYGDAIGLHSGDVIATWLPLYHDMGLICCFLLPLLTGTPIVAMSAFDWVKRPVMLLEAITNYRATLCWLPNFAYSFLAQNVTADHLVGINLSSMRGFINCSEPILSESHQRFLARFSAAGIRPAALGASYAMAEATFAVTSGGLGTPVREEAIDGAAFMSSGRAVVSSPNAAGAKWMVSSGRPIADTDVEIRSSAGEVLPERQVGEIVIKSPSLLCEYHLNPEATATSLRADRFYTGDLGYMADGHLFVCGRKKDLIIVAGKNLYPQDIEDAVNQVNGVIPGRAVAFGVTDEAIGTEKLVVIAETQLENTSARAALTRDIYAVVASVTDGVAGDVVLAEPRWLLKSSSGKIARGANRDRYLRELAAAVTHGREKRPCESEAWVLERSSPIEGVRGVRRCVERVAQRTSDSLLPLHTALFTDGVLEPRRLGDLREELETAFGLRVPPSQVTTRQFASIPLIFCLLRALHRGKDAAAEEEVLVAEMVNAAADQMDGGKWADVRDSLETIVALGQLSNEIVEALASACLRLEDWTAARHWYARLFETSPDNVEAGAALAVLDFECELGFDAARIHARSTHWPRAKRDHFLRVGDEIRAAIEATKESDIFAAIRTVHPVGGTSEVATEQPDPNLLAEVVACAQRVVTRKGRPAEAVAADTLLLNSGMIDSLSMVVLVTELERATSILVPAAELSVQNFATPRSIAITLTRLRTGVGCSLHGPEPTMDAYDAYVSLGFNCEAGLQFKRIGYDEPGFFRYTFSPVATTRALIDRDFSGVFELEHLVSQSPGMVRDVAWGVAYHAPGMCVVDLMAPGCARLAEGEQLEHAYLENRELVLRLVDKWRATTASTKRVAYFLKLRPGETRNDAELIHGLLKARYPQHKFTLICLQTAEYREPDWNVPGLVNRYLPRFAPESNAHDADEAAWDLLFAEFPRREAIWPPVQLLRRACAAMTAGSWQDCRRWLMLASRLRPEDPRLAEALHLIETREAERELSHAAGETVSDARVLTSVAEVG